MSENATFLLRARTVVAQARDALADLAGLLGDDFVEACHLLQALEGNVLTMGVGKSSFVARKMAATMASLGQPAFFVHPVESGHGDLGNVTDRDGVVVFSHSGETAEILQVIEAVKARGAWVMAVCGTTTNSLANAVDVCLTTGLPQESCSLGLAPSTSTTVAMVLADCLALAVAESRGVSREDFARTHPAGRLGRLTTKTVADEMIPRAACAVVHADGSVLDSLIAMASHSLSCAAVVDARTQAYLGLQPSSVVEQAMAVDRHLSEVKNAAYLVTHAPRLQANMVLQEAYALLEQSQTDWVALPVVDEDGILLGLFKP
jgi:arabinose-5-phosphate isomerase